MKKAYLLLVITLFLISCGSDIEQEKENQERDALQKELNDIKFGASKLLSDAKGYIAIGEIENAKVKLKELISRYNDKPEVVESKALMSQIEEQEIWNNALNSEFLNSTNDYLEKYPNGAFVKEATKRVMTLKLLKPQRAFEKGLQAALDKATAKGRTPKGTTLEEFIDEYKAMGNKFDGHKLTVYREQLNFQALAPSKGSEIDISEGRDPNFIQGKINNQSRPTTQKQ